MHQDEFELLVMDLTVKVIDVDRLVAIAMTRVSSLGSLKGVRPWGHVMPWLNLKRFTRSFGGGVSPSRHLMSVRPGATRE
jgi:hypothetical protein